MPLENEGKDEEGLDRMHPRGEDDEVRPERKGSVLRGVRE
jgi:hypothetical protein